MLQNIMSGDILLFKRKSLIGSVISLFTNSDYTHSGIFVHDGMMIDSDWEGVALRPIPKNIPHDVYRHKNISINKRTELMTWIFSKEGLGYDYLGLFGIAYSMLGGLEENLFDNKRRYWCSELVADGYQKIGLPITNDYHSWLVSPADISRAHELKLIKSYEGKDENF